MKVEGSRLGSVWACVLLFDLGKKRPRDAKRAQHQIGGSHPRTFEGIVLVGGQQKEEESTEMVLLGLRLFPSSRWRGVMKVLGDEVLLLYLLA